MKFQNPRTKASYQNAADKLGVGWGLIILLVGFQYMLKFVVYDIVNTFSVSYIFILRSIYAKSGSNHLKKIGRFISFFD